MQTLVLKHLHGDSAAAICWKWKKEVFSTVMQNKKKIEGDRG